MLTVSHIKNPPKAGGNIHRIVFNVPGHPKTRIGAYTGLPATKRMQAKLDTLIAARNQGEPVPPYLADWVRSMPERQAKTLIRVGLIEPRHRRKLKPIDEHIDDFEKVVRSRRANTPGHAKATARCLNRVRRGLNLDVYDDLTETKLVSWLGEQGYSPATQRHYLQAWSGFCKWMVRDNRAQANLLETVNKPAPTPGFDRRPLEVDEARQLLTYLSRPEADKGETDDGKKYTPKPWYDHQARRMVYWTAIKTGYRKTELSSLARHQYHLDDARPYIEIAGRDAKNKTLAGVPIPVELADALREYTSMMSPAVKVFRIPKGTGAKDWLHRDLKGAGLGHVLETGMETDFHSLRATAIVWWLEVDGFSQLVVKELARFKTLAMVQKYVRGFRSSNFERLDASPMQAGEQTEEGAG